MARTELINLIDDSVDIKLVNVYADDEQTLLFIGFQTSDNNIAEDIENIAIQEGVAIAKKAWQSKYNNYVVYDYKPFCEDGFYIQLLFCADSKMYKWLTHLLTERYKAISLFERMYA